MPQYKVPGYAKARPAADISENIYEASLETAHSRRGEVEGAVTEYLWVLFAHRRPDLVVTAAEPATLFAARQQAELFPDVPLLALVEDRSAGLAPATKLP